MPFTTILGGNMKDFFTPFIGGLFAGMFIVIGLQRMSDTSSMNIVENNLKQCEKSLPRDQHCIIIAVPPTLD
jgi:hypothetical protein